MPYVDDSSVEVGNAIPAEDISSAGLCAVPVAGKGGAVLVELHRESSVAVEHVGEYAARDSPDMDAGDRKSEACTDAGLRVAPNVMDGAWVEPGGDVVVVEASRGRGGER